MFFSNKQSIYLSCVRICILSCVRIIIYSCVRICTFNPVYASVFYPVYASVVYLVYASVLYPVYAAVFYPVYAAVNIGCVGRKLAVVSRDDCVRIGGNGANTKPILRHTGIKSILFEDIFLSNHPWKLRFSGNDLDFMFTQIELCYSNRPKSL